MVQGVGFRPFLVRLARQWGMTGWVANSTRGAVFEVQGPPPRLGQFLAALRSQLPSLADCHDVQMTARLPPVPAEVGFAIRPSMAAAQARPCVPPDLAPCAECVRELFDPHNRRFRYPFLSCTACGPRFSILFRLPFDRDNTSLADFPMCPACAAEYADENDRRFHAQTIACPACGPRLSLLAASGRVLAHEEDALRRAEQAVLAGQIVALKGLGGFQLVVDARDESAVRRLRQRKHREAKPFALLVRDLGMASELCFVNGAEAQALASPQTPIVILERRGAAEVAPSVAPDLPWLGLMLPATPLHHLLADDLGIPLVATSGNRSEEPLCYADADALRRLGDIADVFLTHDRPIVRPLDDSVVQVVAGRRMVLRRARGFVPQAICCRMPKDAPALLAVGGHLKNSVAVTIHDQVLLSQHLGDLDTWAARQGMERAVADLEQLFGVKPQGIICDAHPDYAPTVWAEQQAERRRVPLLRVQHHQAHVYACMAEHGLQGPVLGVAWDGTGYGDDGTIWGGEFFVVEGTTCRRIGHLLPFPLVGGDQAARQAWRSALGMLWVARGEEAQRADLIAAGIPEGTQVLELLRRGCSTVWTSSMGRLFDGVASLLGLCHTSRFEGEAAMRLQAAAQTVIDTEGERPYPFTISAEGVVDWRPLLQGLLQDRQQPAVAAARFHATLVEMVVSLAKRTATKTVVLAGGCFQNRLLLRSLIGRLAAEGVEVYWPQAVPTNDGGLSLGQLVAALRPQAASEDEACAWRCRVGS